MRHRVELGDLLLYFTDGVTEAMNARQEPFSDSIPSTEFTRASVHRTRMGQFSETRMIPPRPRTQTAGQRRHRLGHRDTEPAAGLWTGEDSTDNVHVRLLPELKSSSRNDFYSLRELAFLAPCAIL
jgi:hypothetical protein